MNKGKIIAIGVVLSALAVGAYLYFKKDKKKEEETPVDETKDETVKQDSPSVSTQTKTATDTPKVANIVVGKVIKSVGQNRFFRHEIKRGKLTQRSDKAFYPFTDGAVLGRVIKVTPNGFYVRVNDTEIIYTPSSLVRL